VGEALYGLAALAVRHAPREVSLTAAATLATLERTGPRRVTDLAVTEGVSQPSMTAVVRDLHAAGLVERGRDPGDKRVVLVSLTPAGAAYLSARRRSGAAVFAELIDKLPDDEADALVGVLSALGHLRDLAEQRRSRPAPGPGSAGAGHRRGRGPLL
jgi:DNA-binding MarR family transcriptional regulator